MPTEMHRSTLGSCCSEDPPNTPGRLLPADNTVPVGAPAEPPSGRRQSVMTFDNDMDDDDPEEDPAAAGTTQEPSDGFSSAIPTPPSQVCFPVTCVSVRMCGCVPEGLQKCEGEERRRKCKCSEVGSQ